MGYPAYNNPFKRFKSLEWWVKSIRLGGVSDGVLLEDAGSNGLKIGGVTFSAAELAKLDGLSAGAALQVMELRTFTETTGAGTYTASVTVPAAALITDIKVWSTVLWDTTTSATMKVGDAADDDGWYIGINLKATDLVVGEEINFENLGGKEGAYILAASGLRSKAYSASARVVSGIVTTVGAAGSAGRTFMAVLYSLPTATAATKAA